MMIKKQQKNSGFTLIELMVATSIFVVIMLAAMSSLFVMLDAAKSSRALRLAMDNVNFTMESITRSVRMGTNYYCVLVGDSAPDPSNLNTSYNCPNVGGTLLSFVPQAKGGVNPTSRVWYALDTSLTNSNFSTIKRCDNSGCVPIISPDVNIKRLKFFVNGSSESDDKQASVYITMEGEVIVKGVPTSFAIQTLASQRNF